LMGFHLHSEGLTLNNQPVDLDYSIRWISMMETVR